MSNEPKINAIAPWYGSNRMLAENVGKALEGKGWVGIVYGGSLTEVRHITARTLMVNDKHLAVMNLAEVMADRYLGPQLYRGLRRATFHPEILHRAQEICEDLDDPNSEAWEQNSVETLTPDQKLYWAHHYFVSVWMGRSACAGTDGELRGGLAVRWNASGGDSAVRYQNAVGSIPAWRRLLRRCTFSVLDWPDFLMKCKDDPDVGIYCDPPFPGPGNKYKHTMDEDDHRRLSFELSLFTRARVVCRFYDVPLIRELYTPGWEWQHLEGRDQQNSKAKPEVLIVRN